MTLSEAIENAYNADRAYEAAVHAAGYKSRWDAPRMLKVGVVSPLCDAYFAKVEADTALHNAFVAWREKA